MLGCGIATTLENKLWFHCMRFSRLNSTLTSTKCDLDELLSAVEISIRFNHGNDI